MNNLWANQANEQPDKKVLTVRQLNDGIKAALDAAYPHSIWVRGEIQRFPADAARRKHIYFELQETSGSGAANYQIPAQLMDWDRKRFGLAKYLDGSDPDFQIANKLEVCLECVIDFYAPYGKVGLRVIGVDKNFSLGQLEVRRREILNYLKAEGLLNLNSSLDLPELPLHVGLITSVGSAAERDFITGIEASPWGFQVKTLSAVMQGERLQSEVLAALKKHIRSGVEVIVITRGGGSRADLSWFDQKELSEAIARCPIPVITAIGHEIDRSIADEVAYLSCKTPTAAAEFLVDRINQAADRLERVTERFVQETNELLNRAGESINLVDRLHLCSETGLLIARNRLQGTVANLQGQVTGRVNKARDNMSNLRLQLGNVAGSQVTGADRDLVSLTRRLCREAIQITSRKNRDLENLATKTRLLDPQRLLARGYTMTLDQQGQIITEAAALAAGDHISTRFRDGRVQSIVQADGKKISSSQSKSGTTKTRKGKNSGKKEADSSQGSLFR